MASAQAPPVVTALAAQNMVTEEVSAPSAGFAETLDASDYHMLKQYLWKHPNRAGRITLYSGPGGNKVSFSHLADGTPYEECAPHGSWDQQEKSWRSASITRQTLTKLRNTPLSDMTPTWTSGTWLDHMKAGARQNLPSFSLGLMQQKLSSKIFKWGGNSAFRFLRRFKSLVSLDLIASTAHSAVLISPCCRTIPQHSCWKQIKQNKIVCSLSILQVWPWRHFDPLLNVF